VLVKAGVSESVVRRVSQALRQLDLTDNDMNPSEVLKQYSVAPTDEAKSLLEKAVRDAYQPVLSFVNPAEDPPERIRDAFRSYEPRGQQERMVTLFVGLCRHVGLMADVQKPSSDGAKARKPRKPGSTPAKGRATPGSGRSDDSPVQPPLLRGEQQLPPAVDGLVRQLAVIGPTWTLEQRAQFMNLWALTVEFSYPIRDGD
jgi:hypothetical protein